jgi:ferric-dicitrate binding protein FerR (iron transport regulator)
VKLTFPSPEFDDAVAAVCRGEASEEESRALNELLRSDAAARDEYILRLEIHSRLASEPEFFTSAAHDEALTLLSGTCAADPKSVIPFPLVKRATKRKLAWAVALAACLAALAAGMWVFQSRPSAESKTVGNKAVAILNRTLQAQWNQAGKIPQVGTLLQPGRMELRAGLAQIAFFSGARVMIEGPAQIELTSPNEISCRGGRLMAEVPSPAQAFRIRTPHLEATCLAASLGLDVEKRNTELQVLKGSADVSPAARIARQNVQEGTGVLADRSHQLTLIPANPAKFASLLDQQTKSLAAEAQHYTRWRAAEGRLNHDQSLIVHINFEDVGDHPHVRLRDSMGRETAASESIVGCQTVSGRWADKQGVEFQSPSDHVRLNVPGEFNALTLFAWVRVEALDRQFNSLFMCDGFELGEIHWMIVNDGALALTIKGANRGNFRAARSPLLLSPDRFGTWVQLAVVLDGNSQRVTHYFNGRAVSEQALSLELPFRIGAAELGNWNPEEFPFQGDEIRIRNFNGAMDEFCLFSRALTDAEILELYTEGKPESATN